MWLGLNGYEGRIKIMGKVTVVLNDDVEKFLRDHLHKKGDLSNLINDACRTAYGIRKPQE
jgi:hypothetical protein